MKIGRNDPCPCGSGFKYKKCCYSKHTVVEQDELHYRRLSAVHDQLAEHLSRCLDRHYGQDGAAAAMDEFLGWPEADEPLDSDFLDRQQALFWPWLFFNWECEEDNDDGLEGPTDQTLAELYLAEKGDKIDPLAHRLIMAVNRKPLSFWEAMAVEVDKWIDLRDVLTGMTLRVFEKTGSHYIRQGYIVFGRAVLVDGVGMLIGLGGALIPQALKPELIKLRKRIRNEDGVVDDEVLFDWDVEIRKFYFSIDRRLHEPPELSNTDGDPLEFHRLVFDIDDADDVFQRLADLCVSRKPAQIRKDAQLDKQGRIRAVEFVWNRKGHKANAALDNTILGNIKITSDRLTVQLNSVRRAEEIKAVIASRLGTSARYRADEIQDLSSMMTDAPAGAGSFATLEQAALKQIPAVQEQMALMIERHWQGWVDEKIPALNNQTPRKAVTSADGREAVEALLAAAEEESPGDALLTELNRKGVAWVRDILKLTKG